MFYVGGLTRFMRQIFQTKKLATTMHCNLKVSRRRGRSFSTLRGSYCFNLQIQLNTCAISVEFRNTDFLPGTMFWRMIMYLPWVIRLDYAQSVTVLCFHWYMPMPICCR